MGLQKEKLIDTYEVTKVSKTTGEVVMYDENVYDKIIHQQNVNYKLSEKELHQYIDEEIGNFYFLFYNQLENINIQDQYKLRFIYLSSFIDYTTGGLIEKQGNKKVRLSFDGIRELLNLSPAETRKTIKIFVANKLIEKESIYYIMNDKYCLKGNNKHIKNKCTRVFIETIRKLYNETESTKHKQLYIFFKLLPFVNFQYNIITNNTMAEIHRDITPMNMKEIAILLGVDKSNSSRLYKNLKKFKIGNEYVICQHEVNNMMAYSVNPKLYYMGTQIESLKGIQVIFDIAKEVNSN